MLLERKGGKQRDGENPENKMLRTAAHSLFAGAGLSAPE